MAPEIPQENREHRRIDLKREKRSYRDWFASGLSDEMKEKLTKAYDEFPRPFHGDFINKPYPEESIKADIRSIQVGRDDVYKDRVGNDLSYNEYLEASAALKAVQLALLSALKDTNLFGNNIDFYRCSEFDSVGDGLENGVDGGLIFEDVNERLGIEFILDQGVKDMAARISRLEKLVAQGYRSPVKYYRPSESRDESAIEVPKVYACMDRRASSIFLSKWSENGGLDEEEIKMLALPVIMLLQIQAQCSYLSKIAFDNNRISLSQAYDRCFDAINTLLHDLVEKGINVDAIQETIESVGNTSSRFLINLSR